MKSSDGAIYLDSITIEWADQAETTDIIAVENFIQQYMYLDAEVNNKGLTGDMSCLDWFDDARDHFAGNADKGIQGLTDAQKAIILTSDSIYSGQWKYTDVRDRLAEWAAAKGVTFNTSTGVFSAAIVSLIGFTTNIDSSLPLLVTVLIVGAVAASGYIFLRKKKEN